MPKFFLDLRTDRLHRDTQGLDCNCLRDLLGIAEDRARFHLLTQNGATHWCYILRDESGQELCLLPFRSALPRRAASAAPPGRRR